MPIGPSTDSCIMRDRNMSLNHNGKPPSISPFARPFGGPISVLTGVTRDFIGAFLACFFLGIYESAFFPVSSHLRISRTYSYGMAGCVVPPFEMVQAQ